MKPLLLILTILLTGCVKLPETVTPVQGFELDRFLGKWYEIARLDHSFERGESQVSFVYEKRQDGGISVQHNGYLDAEDKWRKTEGKAYFVESPDIGFLKISFWGPFYGSYVVFEVDKENYQYAFLSGPDISYVWFLSRTPTASSQMKQYFRNAVKDRGVDIEKLIFVEQKP